MQQVKLFFGVENRPEDLERDVNAFLAETGARCVNIFGNIAPQTPGTGAGDAERVTSTSRRFAPSDVFLCVVYEK